MRDLRKDLRQYIDLRRALGYKLRKHEPRLTEFVGFLKAQGTDRITTKLALAWATAPTFFINERGGPISSPHKSFRDIRCAAGLEQIGNGIHPRMHDLRHTFAVQTLLAWYRSGADVERNLPILSTFLGHSHIEHTYWYLTSPPELLGAACERLEMRWESSMMSSENLAALLQTFFTDRLIAQRRVSPHTVASYRDTFRLLLQFTQKQLGRSPSHLGIVDLSSALIGAFLDDREKNRANATRSRNVRLTAIRSFFRYAALECPEHSAGIQRLLAIPPKRQSSRLVDFLTRPEIDALLEVPDQKTWLGRRDRVLLLFTIQTGLRLSELIGLRQDNIYLERGAHVRCEGKGRKQRCTPLTRTTVRTLKAWVREEGQDEAKILFPSARGGRLSHDSVQYLVSKYAKSAANSCATLRNKRVTPHVLRHTTAMELLQAGVDRSVIALWLGHESVETTQIYLDANLAVKEEALKKTSPVNTSVGRFKPDDQLLSFLRNL